MHLQNFHTTSAKSCIPFNKELIKTGLIEFAELKLEFIYYKSEILKVNIEHCLLYAFNERSLYAIAEKIRLSDAFVVLNEMRERCLRLIN